MKNEKWDVLIGQGIGEQQPWAWELQKALEPKLSVWNESLPDAQIPGKKIPEEWSELFESLISPDLTAILHSASAISFLDALLRKGEPIKNIFLLAAWLKDPVGLGGKEGKKTERVFTNNGSYLLKPFLQLTEKFITRLQEVSELVREKIFICQSLNDPYVASEQADFLQQEVGGELIKIPDAGHFQFRKKDNQNEILPGEIRKKILEVCLGNDFTE